MPNHPDILPLLRELLDHEHDSAVAIWEQRVKRAIEEIERLRQVVRGMGGDVGVKQ